MQSYEEPVYLISVVAKILKIHPQTLRQYEKEGLVLPSRTQGKMRLYSQKDMDKIKTVLRLTRDMGVNLAGVDIILRLKDRLDELDALNSELKAKGFSEGTKGIENNMSSYELIVINKKS
ncbi:helix-turn-helix transcriptional regulator [Helicobacter sp. 11S02629-2]|uniref:heat shock protein transcriptional repressor HspR n=1 Tax=Helicobacter sp. 11S02629-2 TaxID=1476195 RepID=UPI000BA7CF56|nr:helix-turn-helix transcriptional regulator [Helicobacter sp. 11S02629-2]PAF45703.1 MerR family transcriptional regulator [Helicobacter sp. 11S02629-2]